MSRQYFADTLTEPVGIAYTQITATTETVLIATAFTPIPANEPRSGKVYELIVGGSCTVGATGTLTITPRYGLVIGGTSLTASQAQTVPASSTAPFLYKCYLTIRTVGLPGANSTVLANGVWISGGLAGTASTSLVVTHFGSASVDVSVASGLWIGVTFSVAPTIVPQWHIWRSLN